MSTRKRQILWILALFLVVVTVDQVTKALIMARFPQPETYYDASGGPTFFRLTHQRNPGLVGGMFREHPRMAMAMPLMATAVLLYLFFHLDPASKLQSVAYGLTAGGAVGNLIDRLRLGSVTDFLQFNFYFIPFDFPWKHYPAFNIADSSICTGVFVLIVTWWMAGPENLGSKKSEEPAQS